MITQKPLNNASFVTQDLHDKEQLKGCFCILTLPAHSSSVDLSQWEDLVWLISS